MAHPVPGIAACGTATPATIPADVLVEGERIRAVATPTRPVGKSSRRECDRGARHDPEYSAEAWSRATPASPSSMARATDRAGRLRPPKSTH